MCIHFRTFEQNFVVWGFFVLLVVAAAATALTAGAAAADCCCVSAGCESGSAVGRQVEPRYVKRRCESQTHTRTQTHTHAERLCLYVET